jgi:predicted Zn-dependent protease with MMP-like domain
MAPEDFDRLVAAAWRRIPRRFRTQLRNITLVVKPEPSAAQLASARIRHPSTLLGLYEGRPLTGRSVSDGFVLPDRITVFQGPHERLAQSEADLARLVEETVWHEVGHYFGMGEAAVRAAERARRSRGRGP